MELADRIKALMLSNNHHLKDLANGAGVSISAVSKWLNGGDITDKNLERVASFYRVSPFYLKYGVDNVVDADDQFDQLFAEIRRLNPECFNAVKLVVDGLRALN